MNLDFLKFSDGSSLALSNFKEKVLAEGTEEGDAGGQELYPQRPAEAERMVCDVHWVRGAGVQWALQESQENIHPKPGDFASYPG